ncbi:14171_t:CDS:2, partial [Entrophospora sp. SA101]
TPINLAITYESSSDIISLEPKIHPQFLIADDFSMSKSASLRIMEPVTLKEEDTEKHIFDFKVKHNETGEFLLTWSFDEYSNSDNCIIEYFVKVDGDLYGNDDNDYKK